MRERGLRERGSVGLSLTVVLLCILPATVPAVSLATTALSAARTVSGHREAARRRSEAVATAAAYLSDRVIAYGTRKIDIPTKYGPVVTAVTDLASRFPVYWIPVESVPVELWAVLLLPGVSVEQFEAARTACGPSLDTDRRFAGVVELEVFDEFFTAYARDAGPWEADPGEAVINVNAAPLVVLEAAVARTGIAHPAHIAQRLESLRRRGPIRASDLATIDPSGRLQTVLRDSPVFLELQFVLDEVPVVAVLERDSCGEFRVFAGPRTSGHTKGSADRDR